ncbi:hypothetical protein F4553_003209 [Allocatelliglobosispora scoriae]|uniref:DUF2613 family protein n=1 Tax=Allocatelliglobosispora scoriae TaxID=643052 RepID=A0A841BSR3_9ACTN|nr:hypothetical protein [Allocatelliglobosispora scoriae]MBB5869830.1 hypothetical protein [Allocatelliglobosispora scoriae]
MTAVVAVALGVVGLTAVPGLVAATSADAANSADAKDAAAPEGYGVR